MSVRRNERKPSLMEVQLKAQELVEYTISSALKERIVPKRDRWALGNRLVDAALELARRIDVANTLRLDNEDEARQRRLEQRMALAATFTLMTLIHTTRDLTRFDEATHRHWTELVAGTQDRLRGWMESDRRRVPDGDMKDAG